MVKEVGQLVTSVKVTSLSVNGHFVVDDVTAVL